MSILPDKEEDFVEDEFGICKVCRTVTIDHDYYEQMECTAIHQRSKGLE